VEGGAVHDDVGPEPLERGADDGRVAEIEVLVREAGDVFPAKRLDDVAAELAGGPDDGDARQKTLPIRLSVLSMSARSVIQSML
jgi:hypothetical protein